MKETKYVVGFALVLAVIDVALLAILKIANAIDQTQFQETMTRSLSILGIVALGAIVISLVVSMFKTK